MYNKEEGFTDSVVSQILSSQSW